MSLDPTPSFRSRVLNALLWSTASSLGTKVLDFLVILILARLLSPADFGLVSLVMIYIAFANIFVEGGFAQAIIQRDKITELHFDTAFWTSVSIGLSLTVSTFLFGPAAFEAIFDETTLGPVVQAASVLFVVAALKSVQQATLARNLRFKELAFRKAAGTVAGGIVAVTMAFRGYGVWSLVALHVVSGVVGVAVLWLTSNWRPRARFSATCFRDLFSFGVHLVGRQMLGFFKQRGLSLLIGLLLGASALGFFVLANRIVHSVLDLVTTSVQSVALPAFSRLQKNQRKLRSAFYQAIHFTSLISFPIFIGLAGSAVLLIQVLLGEKWQASAPVLQFLCFVGILDSIVRYTHSVMLARGKSNWSLYISAAYPLAGAGAFFLAYHAGIAAVAFAYAAVGYLLAPLSLMAVKKLIGISYRDFARELLPAVIASAAMLALISSVEWLAPASLPPTAHMIALVLLGGVTYLAALYFTDRSVLTNAVGVLAEMAAGLRRRSAGRRAD